MSVILFKNGGKTICDPFSLASMLDAGWSLTENEEIHEENVLKDEGSIHSLPNDGGGAPVVAKSMTDDEVRQAAKTAGVKMWWKKKIETLLEELTSVNQS